MPLFKRKTEELVPPPAPSYRTWSARLGGIGEAIDSTDLISRDVAIVTEGGPGESGAVISLLCYDHGRFRAGWTSMTYRLERGDEVLVRPSDGVSITKRRAGASDATPVHPGDWGARLRGIGALIDSQPRQTRSVTVIDVPGGAVVNAIVREPVFGVKLQVESFEFADEHIRAAAAASAPPASPRTSPAKRTR